MPLNITPNPQITPVSFFQRWKLWIMIGVFLLLAAAAIGAMMYFSTKPVQAQEKDTCAIQRQLAKKGFYEGEIDCSNGPSTRAAVKAFQRREGLFVDGEVGEDTYKRLFGRFRHEPEERGGNGYSERRAVVEGERCADEPIEATVMRATESRGKAGSIKAWESEVLRKEGLGLVFSSWGDAADTTLSCKKIASWNWNCIAKARPCRGK